jgi:antitoxin component of MazEF toxin-antitoxin module
MLKKLVKYGNSNALVLDKAILELLNIEEGSLIKIKTDGKAIIITAHEAATTQEKISPVITHQETLKEATAKEMLKQYPQLDDSQKDLFTKEFSNYQKMTTLVDKYNLHPNVSKEQMAAMQADFTEHFKKQTAVQAKVANAINNPEYMHEMQLLSEKYVALGTDSSEYIKATREVLYKYVPEMRQADEELAAIAKKYQ